MSKNFEGHLYGSFAILEDALKNKDDPNASIHSEPHSAMGYFLRTTIGSFWLGLILFCFSTNVIYLSHFKSDYRLTKLEHFL